MILYECKVCGWVYNPQEGDAEGSIAPETAFHDIPETWECPICGSKKNIFFPKKEEWS